MNGPKKLKVRFNEERKNWTNKLYWRSVSKSTTHFWQHDSKRNTISQSPRSNLTKQLQMGWTHWSYKYKISRKALETMYKSFILPLFDYADIVWDNCTDIQSKKLESLHLEAIRIGIRGTSHQKLYIESGFCTLKERQKRINSWCSTKW